HKRDSRPTAYEVVTQLKKALEFQEDYEKWEPKLPKDYKEIIKMSKCPEIYSTKKKEELYNIFCKGILLQQDKVAMTDLDLDAYDMCRFETVVEILDISDMNFEVKTRAQFLSPDVVYGVYLVFKFCDSKHSSSKPMYVNLRYRHGHKSLHAYFATWRDEQWMMIELHRFLNQNEDVVFEFLLESFSSYYSGDVAVYVEGVEFRAIEKVEHEGVGKLIEVPEVLKSNFNVDWVHQLPTDLKEIFKINRNYEELFWLGNIDRMKLLIVSAKAALYNVSNGHLFTSKSSSHSRKRFLLHLDMIEVVYDWADRRKGKEPWTEEEDKMLVDALLELHLSGKYVYAPFGSGYAAAVKRLMDKDRRHHENFYSLTSIKFRMHNIKNEFCLVHEMVTGLHRSGFSWDSETLCVIAGDQVWGEYIKRFPLAAQFRTKPFPQYYKLRAIFIRDTTTVLQGDGIIVKEEDIVEENHGIRESESNKCKRNDASDVIKNHVESKVANQGINAANDTMSKVATQIKGLPSLKLSARLMAMSVTGRSEPLSVMFDQLDQEGKVRTAQMVADGMRLINRKIMVSRHQFNKQYQTPQETSEPKETCVANQGINAANEIMDIVTTPMKDLQGLLTLDELLSVMSVIGRSAPLSLMFERLDDEGKVRTAQMVANGYIT
nr:protein kinase-like domain, phloem protein 2-like protein [Tanacetum cinerariifolium]